MVGPSCGTGPLFPVDEFAKPGVVATSHASATATASAVTGGATGSDLAESCLELEVCESEQAAKLAVTGALPVAQAGAFVFDELPLALAVRSQ